MEYDVYWTDGWGGQCLAMHWDEVAARREAESESRLHGRAFILVTDALGDDVRQINFKDGREVRA